MKERLNSYKDLIVWKKSYELTLFVYKITKKFPSDELYGLVTQMRRAAVSIVSNIAEGYSRKGRMEYVQFLSMAYGSLSELETQIMLANDLGYTDMENYNKLISLKDEIGGMLYVLIHKLNVSTRRGGLL